MFKIRSFSFWCGIMPLLLVLNHSCQQAPARQATRNVQETRAGQVLREAAPSEAGMSATGLARVDSLLEAYVNNQWIPGVVALVARHGKVVYHKAIGMNNVEQDLPIAKDNLFRIASMTKAITSVAVMMLQEQGKLQLDDPVAKYIPEFANAQVLGSLNLRDTSYTATPATTPVTIRHLLTHTSGIGYSFVSPEARVLYGRAGVPDGATPANVVIGEKIKVLARLPLLHQPGEKFTYGLSTDVLGYLVEVISGKTLSDFLELQIMRPLGMEDTYFFIPAEKAGRLANLYTEAPDRKTIRPFPARTPGRNTPVAGAKTYFSGGSGLSSTAMDYAIFLQMLLNGGEYGGKRLLKAATVAQMTRNHIGDLSVDDGKFGLGFSIATGQGHEKTLQGKGRYGWRGIFNTAYWVDPAHDIVAVVMTQVIPSSHKDLFVKFERLTNEAIIDRK
jgi:CubicO group peptidase (beta-lactamase class C family)